MEGIEDLRAVCSAPGKVILFGEHAVVYGHPAVAAATDQRTVVEVDVVGKKVTVNGFRIHKRYHSYLLTAVDHVWKQQDAVRLQTEGGVPSASGTGSSAALTVAAVGALRRLQQQDDLGGLAQQAFEVERLTQGGGSPTDTSTSTAGGGIAIAGGDKRPDVGKPLWDVHWEDATWSVERIPLPEMSVVVGNTGIKGRTDEQVAKVARAAKKNVVVRETLEDIGTISRDAVAALGKSDWVALGALMDKAHRSLHTLGVNHPSLQHLVDAVRDVPGTYGAKLTGAGGGGSIIVLTDKPLRAARAIEDAGGTPYPITLGGDGVRWEEAIHRA